MTSASRVEPSWATGKISVPKGDLDPSAAGAAPAGGNEDPEEATEDRPSSRSVAEFAAYLAHRLKWRLGDSQRECRLRRRSSSLSFFSIGGVSSPSRLSVEGLATCKSCMCALCVRKWERTRAGEIKTAMDYHAGKHGEECVKFITATPKHHNGMSLALLHRINTKTWGEFYSGRKGQNFSRKLAGYMGRTPEGPACRGEGTERLPPKEARRRWRQVCAEGPSCDSPGAAKTSQIEVTIKFPRPESIRAHDRTCSKERGWHPHCHGLVFLPVPGDDEELEELFFQRWSDGLPRSVRSFKKHAQRILDREPCAFYKRHARKVKRYKKEAAAPERCVFGLYQGVTAVHSYTDGEGRPHEFVLSAPVPNEDAGWTGVRAELVVTAGPTAKAVECMNGADLGWKSIPEAKPNTRRNREQIRRRGDQDRDNEHHGEASCTPVTAKRNHEQEIRWSEETGLKWGTILGAEQCWDCHHGTDCPHVRERAEHEFGLRMVRRHVPLHLAALNLLKELKKFDEKNIRPRRAYGLKLETARDPDKLQGYLVKLGAMGFELAAQTSKANWDDLGHMGGDGHRHYAVWDVGYGATLRRHPDRAWFEDRFAELFSATFGTQTITFSSRERLGLGPDPYAKDDEPEEAIDGESKVLVAEGEPGPWDEAVKERGHLIYLDLERAFRANALLGLAYCVQPGEAFERARSPPDDDHETGPPLRSRTCRERDDWTPEIFRRALDTDEATKRIEDRRSALDERDGRAAPGDPDVLKLHALRTMFLEMRAQHDAAHPARAETAAAE